MMPDVSRTVKVNGPNVKVTGLQRISIKKRYNSGTDKFSMVKLEENYLRA